MVVEQLCAHQCLSDADWKMEILGKPLSQWDWSGIEPESRQGQTGDKTRELQRQHGSPQHM